ncbi:MAG TPA: hypothetical protein VF953_11605 [Terriglobales bacterium]
MPNPNETPQLVSTLRHAGPHLGALAIVYTVLFNAGLYPVTIFASKTHFPGPWEPGDVIVSYFQTHALPVLMCAFLQFGATIALGIFTASVVSRLHFLGVRAAGPYIALFGGFATVFGGMAASSILWVMIHPGIAQDATLLRAMYYLSYAFGGPGFSVPMGLLLAGVSVPAAFMKLLPKWVVALGLALAVCGELSWLNLIAPKALFLIPLVRFPSFIWLIATGFMLPRAVARPSRSSEVSA